MNYSRWLVLSTMSCVSWASSDESCKATQWGSTVLKFARTHRTGSTTFLGWLRRAIRDSSGRLHAYVAGDAELPGLNVSLQGWTEWVDRRMSRKGNCELDGARRLVVTLVRSPQDHFVSFFDYFGQNSGEDYGTISSILRGAPGSDALHNLMSRDLGWNESVGQSMSPQEFAEEVDRRIDVALVTDHWPESLVLLRRTLGLGELDMSLLRLNPSTGFSAQEKLAMMGPEEQRLLRQWNAVEFAVFQQLNETLWRKVSAGGPDFLEEVHHVRLRLQHLQEVCTRHCLTSHPNKIWEFLLPLNAGNSEEQLGQPCTEDQWQTCWEIVASSQDSESNRFVREDVKRGVWSPLPSA